jgi:cell division protein FtsI (penicillin-binding protein 3)
MTVFRRKARAVSPDIKPRPSLDEVREDVLEIGRNRLVVVAAVFALAFTIIGGRLIDLAVWQGGQAASTQAAARHGGATFRADIIDRNGVILATDLSTASLYAEPRRMLNPEAAARKLLAVFPALDHNDLRLSLASDKAFVCIKRHLTPKQKYLVNALGIPGVGFRDDHKRVYPHGALLAHVVGSAGVDNEGLTGIEKRFDDQLLGSAARLSTGRLAGSSTESGRKRGDQSLRLSIDVRVQYALREELSRAVEEFSALGAAGIVMDARSGEVVAMVSLPDYDLNQAGTASTDARFNRASLGVYEMGSTFKVFTVAMALDLGTVKIGGGYDATKPLRVARFTIRDDHPKARWLSVPEIFIYSSNIGAAKMAQDVGGKRQKEFLARLGLLQRASLELPEVGRPMSPSPWREINTMTVGFGHGIAVSPVQLASAVATLVNGGFSVKPTLLARAGAASSDQRLIKQRTSRIMQRLMRLNVVRGTGKKSAAPGYLVGGKTGTAEKSGGNGYRRKALLSSFVGAFPMNDPRYVVLAVLDEPQGTKATFGFASGGWTAAPVVGRLISRVAPMLGVLPVDETSPTTRNAMFIPVKSAGGRVAAF